MITVEFPVDKKPLMSEICTIKIAYYKEQDKDIPNIDWIEKNGEVILVVPCKDGLVIIQRDGIKDKFIFCVDDR